MNRQGENFYNPIAVFSFFKNHPFAIEAFFESSVVLTFAVAKAELQALLPSCLEVDAFDNKWGFVAVAMVQTKNLRLNGFPAIFGKDFFLIGYRIFTRYNNVAGKNLRGLYILQSTTDKKSMQWLGNTFTHYKYTTAAIKTTTTNQCTTIQSAKDGFTTTFVSGAANINLPDNSPFADWKEARRFAGPLPFTFSYLPAKNELLIVEGVRQFWKPHPVSVCNYRFPFIESLGLSRVQLASAFIVQNIPYHWKKGKIEKL